jgi:hypothetical protein
MSKPDCAAAARLAESEAGKPGNAAHAEVLRAAARVAEILRERPAAIVKGARSLVGTRIGLKMKTGTLNGELKRATDERLVVATTYTINRQKRHKTVEVAWTSLSPAQEDEFAAKGGLKADPADLAIGRVYAALAENDATAAGAALEAGGNHLLAAHLTRCVAEAKAAREAAMARARQAVAPTQRYEVVLRQGEAVPALGIAAYAGTTDTGLAHKDPKLAGPERGAGGAGTLYVGVKGSSERRAVIRFDLDSIPRTAKVEKAVLSLYCRTIAEGTLGVYRVTSPWAPSEKQFEWGTGASWTFASGKGKARRPWGTAGGDFDTQRDWGWGSNGLVCAPAAYAWRKTIVFDLTGLVRAWVSGKVPNHGVLLKPERWRSKEPGHLHSAEAKEAETRPALPVTFTAPRRVPPP